MGYSQAQKQANHDRILDAAIDLLRRKGLEHTGIAEVMRAAGLTHGGFYSHFESREAMVEEALNRAFAADEARLEKAVARSSRHQRAAMIEAYLSPQHRDDPVHGCAAAALAGDVARAEAPARHIFTEQLKRYRDRIAPLIPTERGKAEGHALFGVAAMIGALLLSRAVDDEELSESILAATRRHLMERMEEPEPENTDKKPHQKNAQRRAK
ncbi:TetR/AcrR family transcriptional regulator [Zavarzinia sp.]|uniref:TetR/AcrR family transcriptional regulator n=1 Tax=Zavarzinia sp. TaxID=2027920 RepID=UPI003561BFBB